MKVKKTHWARKCDVTGQGMNEGWCWGDGVFYTATLEDTLKECRKDRDNILDGIKHVAVQVNNDLRYAIERARQGKETDEDLLLIGYETEYLYYTEWYDDYEYVEENGELKEI